MAQQILKISPASQAECGSRVSIFGGAIAQDSLHRNGTLATLAYNDADESLGESFTGGTLDTVAVTVGYDAYLRRTLNAARSSTMLHQDSLGYDAAGRLQTVTDNTGATAYSGTYSYVANSPLVSQIAFKQSTTTRMTTTKNRLAGFDLPDDTLTSRS